MSLPRPRRAGRLRRWALAGLAVLTAAALAYGGYAAAGPLPAAHAQLRRSTQVLEGSPAQVQWPAHGVAAFGLAGRPGLLGAHGGAEPIPTASMAKVVTALVILAKKPLSGPADPGPTIRFTAHDERVLHQVIARGGSWASVTPGVPMSERQALTAMLLPSANNYAISLAQWAFGSLHGFRAAAESWLAAHGLTGTHLADPTGLSPKTRSTLADLVAIAGLARRNSALSAIVDTREAAIPGAGVQKNRNTLLGVAGIDGVKTGNTDQAGFCLLFSTTLHLGSHTRVIVGVIAGQPDLPTLFTAATRLVESVRAGFRLVDLTGPGTAFGSYRTAWGQEAALTAPGKATALVWSDTPVTARVSARPITSAPAGTRVGTVTFRAGGQRIGAGTLTLAAPIRPPSLAWLLAHPPRRR